MDVVEIDEPPAAGDPGPTSDAAAGPAATWVAQRRPVALATLLIVVVTLAGWGVHRWGPLNPEVVVSSFTDDLQPGATSIFFSLENKALAPIEVIGVSVVPDPTQTNGGVPTAATGSRGALGDAIGPTIGAALPLTVPGGARASLSTDLLLPGCRPGAALQPFRVVVQIRTQAGRTIELPASNRSTTGSCGQVLPTGTPPADPVASTDAVTSAYDLVYDSTTPAETRGSLIDDPHGLDEATRSAPGAMASTIATTRATVTEVSFDRPDHAWVRYDLTGPGVGIDLRGYIGEATRIDGRWKVSRRTVCRDLSLAGAVCPP